MRPWRVGLVAGILAVALVACGDGGNGDATGGEDAGGTGTTARPSRESTTTVAARAAIAVGRTALGDVLVDADGRTLYLFTRDSGDKSACSGQCAQTWPPLVVSGEATAGSGLDAAMMGAITRDDGSRQVTYGGHPLYRYGPDQAPGDTKGQGVGGVWFAVSPAGEAVTTGAGG